MENLDDSPNILYKFEFKTPSGSCQVTTVYSESMINMNLFLNQHQFDKSLVTINMTNIEELGSYTVADNLLKPYFFRSNNDNKVYRIMTTNNIVTENIAHSVASELSNLCIFGDVITKIQHPIFEILIDLLGSLNYVQVLDLEKLECSQVKPEWRRDLYPAYPTEAMCDGDDGYDDSFIYEQIVNKSLDTENPSITLEGYVTMFAQMFVDPREE